MVPLIKTATILEFYPLLLSNDRKELDPETLIAKGNSIMRVSQLLSNDRKEKECVMEIELRPHWL